MTGIVVDFAWFRPTIQELKSWNAVAVLQYVGQDNTGKNLTINDVKLHSANGIRTITCFEYGAKQAELGFNQGINDATLALQQAHACGQPSWAPIMFAVDEDLKDYAPNSDNPVAKLGPVADYFNGVCKVLGIQNVAGYGSYYVIQRLTAAHLISYAMQTLAWSGGQVDTADITLYQAGKTLDNGQVDIDEITDENKINRLAWFPNEPDPQIPGVLSHWQVQGNWSIRREAQEHNTSIEMIVYLTIKYGGWRQPFMNYVNIGNWDANLPAGTDIWVQPGK